jgi:hypothetical protein
MLQEADKSLPSAATENPPTKEPAWLRPLVEQILRETGGHASAATPFCDFSALVRRLPMYGERTLRELIKRKIIPSVRPPGSRKLAFHIPSVEAALLRYQHGGPPNLST